VFLSVIVDVLNVLDDIGSISSAKLLVRPRVIDKDVLFVEKCCDFVKGGDGGASN